MKRIKIMVGCFLLLLLFGVGIYKVHFEARASDNISVTIPSEIAISFDEDGSNTISKFCVDNDSPVPISIGNISVIEQNGWELVEKGQEILVNQKKMVLQMDEQCIHAGQNAVDIPVGEKSSKDIEIDVTRGAWTSTEVVETALHMEIEYVIGKKEFSLCFDTNGSDDVISDMKVLNGDTVDLPKTERDYFEFRGWEDDEGNVYRDIFIMPIGDVTLTAQWVKTEAYAIYSSTDASLTLCRSATPISAGGTYNGKVVTAVYSGFEKASYAHYSKVPWFSHVSNIKSIYVEDKISPVNTAYWFHNMRNCSVIDMTGLDMSNVTTTAYMFQWTAMNPSTVTFKGIGDWNMSKVTNTEAMFDGNGQNATTFSIPDLSNWNVSSVTDMSAMFRGVARYNASSLSLGDLSKWDVSNVTDMQSMFAYTGEKASWKLDLSGWSVGKVINHSTFNTNVTTKVLAPKWVN